MPTTASRSARSFPRWGSELLKSFMATACRMKLGGRARWGQGPAVCGQPERGIRPDRRIRVSASPHRTRFRLFVFFRCRRRRCAPARHLRVPLAPMLLSTRRRAGSTPFVISGSTRHHRLAENSRALRPTQWRRRLSRSPPCSCRPPPPAARTRDGLPPHFRRRQRLAG